MSICTTIQLNISTTNQSKRNLIHITTYSKTDTTKKSIPLLVCHLDRVTIAHAVGICPHVGTDRRSFPTRANDKQRHPRTSFGCPK